VVDNIGRSGGLDLFWNKEVDVEIKNYNQRHINAEVCSEPNGQAWKFTGFYGNFEPGKWRKGWSLLRYLSSLNPQAWLCLSDFNEITKDSEKFGAALRHRWQMENFNNTLAFCWLQDLGYSGAMFTWCNYREDDHFIEERIDRAMATPEWSDLFPVKVEVLANRSSDHTPLLISFNKQVQVFSKRNFGFRYEANWSKNDKTKQVVRQAWKRKHHQRNTWEWVKKILHAVKKILPGGYNPTFAEKMSEIQKPQEQEGVLHQTAIRGLQDKVNELLKQDDMKWSQRAKKHWLKMEDRNSKFFHACASQRRWESLITNIWDEEGNNFTAPIDIEEAFVKYFQKFFTSSIPIGVDTCLQNLTGRVMQELNFKLL
jgi:hypothetical protein